MRIVYFSSVTENTKTFLEQLPYSLTRIPVYSKEQTPVLSEPYILAFPTYGGGWTSKMLVPAQVRRFLDNPENRRFCIGIIGSGNKNFAETYTSGADLAARKLQVPVLARFEIRGDSATLKKIDEGIRENWEKLVEARGL